MTTLVTDGRYVIADRRVSLTTTCELTHRTKEESVGSFVSDTFTKLIMPAKGKKWIWTGNEVVCVGFSGGVNLIKQVLALFNTGDDMGHFVKGTCTVGSKTPWARGEMWFFIKSGGFIAITVRNDGKLAWNSFLKINYAAMGSGAPWVDAMEKVAPNSNVFELFMYGTSMDPASCNAFDFIDLKNLKKGVQPGMVLTERQIKLKLKALHEKIVFHV